jgi:hypothetical protein
MGSIVSVTMTDRNGHSKVRPAVVVTRNVDVAAGRPIIVVAISGTFSEPLPPEWVPAPWAAGGHPRTKLHRPSVAVCDWQEVGSRSDIVAVTGFMPLAAPTRIVEVIERPSPP